MKVECVKENLRGIVSQLERATGKQSTLPVLQSILVSAKGNKLILRATNLDIGIETEIPSDVKEEGVVAIPAQTLSQTLQLIDSKKIKIETNNQTILISGEKQKTTIKCVPHEDFPTIPLLNEGNSFSVDIESFINGIQSVIFAAAVSDIKPELSSVYIYSDGGALVFVSTDSFRLAEKRISIKNTPQIQGIIIPFKNAQEIIRLCEGRKGSVDIIYTKHQISLSFDHTYLTSRAIDGIFPDYKQIIPKNHNTEAVVLKQDLLQALKLSTLFSDKFNQITCTISPKKKQFTIESKNQDTGESSLSLDAALIGDDVELRLNARYILEGIPSIHQDSVVFWSVGHDKPLIVKAVGEGGFSYLVMPMNK